MDSPAGPLSFRAGPLSFRAGPLSFRAGLLGFRAGLLGFRAGLLSFRVALAQFPSGRAHARRGTRNHRSGIPAIAGRQSSTAHRTDRADDRDARGEVTRDRNTKNSRRPVLLRTTQRPRSANNETTTTTRHPDLRDPRPDSSEDRLRGVACSFIERH